MTTEPTPLVTVTQAGVCYRQGKPTIADYNEAITDLLCARRQLKSGSLMGCEVCGDSGHAAQDGCHHDPLILARKWTAATRVWCCYHCGFVATNDDEARDHFGRNEFDDPACATAIRALSNKTGEGSGEEASDDLRSGIISEVMAYASINTRDAGELADQIMARMTAHPTPGDSPCK